MSGNKKKIVLIGDVHYKCIHMENKGYRDIEEKMISSSVVCNNIVAHLRRRKTRDMKLCNDLPWAFLSLLNVKQYNVNTLCMVFM